MKTKGKWEVEKYNGTDETYHKFKNMINSRAWGFHRTTGLPFEEVQSICMVAFAEALNKYNPDRGTSFSTLLHTYCTNALINFCKYEGREIRPEFNWEPKYMPHYDGGIDLKQAIKQMSNEAQAVIEILFECPDELLQLAKKGLNKSCHYRGALKQFLRGLSWSEPKITKTFIEIRGVVAGL